MKAKSVYSTHPLFKMEAAYADSLLKRDGPATEKERREWLKATHGLTTNYCWWVAERAEGRGGAEQYDPDAYVEAMFANKPALRPLYDRLLKLGLALGK